MNSELILDVAGPDDTVGSLCVSSRPAMFVC